ncbi:MAG TPA: hypothetical protein VMD02_04950, partial [Candidatus Omnitrophota bacterium]|nr:hypothetical protein [Candidatus Omnitrophota bacterium]
MKIKYFDRAIEVLFLAAMFFIPIIFDRRIGIVFSGTKSAFLRLIIIIIALIWTAKLLLGGKHIFRRTPLDWPVVAYLFVIGAATINSVHPVISFWGFYGRYEGCTTWLCLGALFFVTTNYFPGIANIKRIAAIIQPVAVIMAVYGVIQRYLLDPYAWGGVVTSERIIATIGQPNFLAAYVIMAFYLALYFVLEPAPEAARPAAEKHHEKTSKAKPKAAPGMDRYLDLLPLLYFILVPVLFVVTIFTQSGINIFLWYLLFLAMTVFACLFAYTYDRLPKPVLELLMMFCLVMSYLCLFYTQSRGGFIGFAVGAAIFLFVVPKDLLFSNWKKLVALGAVMLIIAYLA